MRGYYNKILTIVPPKLPGFRRQSVRVPAFQPAQSLGAAAPARGLAATSAAEATKAHTRESFVLVLAITSVARLAVCARPDET